jgi:hypothetical protein
MRKQADLWRVQSGMFNVTVRARSEERVIEVALMCRPIPVLLSCVVQIRRQNAAKKNGWDVAKYAGMAHYLTKLGIRHADGPRKNTIQILPSDCLEKLPDTPQRNKNPFWQRVNRT